VVSTPDHTHAVIALMAMRMGKHVFCEKPLCRYVAEARQLATVAREQKVVTQMGNQGTAMAGFRRALDAVRSGRIGSIREVHVWSGRFNRPSGPNARPTAGGSPPAGLHWDEFVGPAAMQPFSSDFLNRQWQGWWPFGTGPLGDLACHMLNLAFHAVDLRNPATVQAQHTGHNQMAFPQSSSIRWEFPATPRRPAVTLLWYDGGRKPDASLFDGEPVPTNGCLLVGERGKLLAVRDEFNSQWMLLPERATFVPDAKTYFLPAPPSQFGEFVEAIRQGGTTMSNFPDVAGPMNEVVLLGNLALWAGPDSKLDWDAATMNATGARDLADAIRPSYRAGYTL
jgi:predicted dehydrogenase